MSDIKTNEIKISEMIRQLRTDKGISQEMLADVCDVSMQAVSKWENGQSCPDISFLPLLAQYFGVSTDYLLTGKNHALENPDDTILSSLSGQELKDDVLYIVQYRNGKILDKKQWDTEQPENRDTVIKIQFDEAFAQLQSEFYVEVWGNADIHTDLNTQDVKMNLSAGGNVSAGANIQGNVSAGANVSCGANIQGDVNAGADISCDGSIQGNVDAGAGVKCDMVEGDVSAGNSVNCDTVKGDVSAGCSVNCSTIEGDASAGNYISCDHIEGSADASRFITHQK